MKVDETEQVVVGREYSYYRQALHGNMKYNTVRWVHATQ